MHCFERGRTLNLFCRVYVTAHRCAGGLKELDPWSGSQRHRHFGGFFNVLVKAQTRGQRLYGNSEKLPRFIRLLRRSWGYGGPIFVLNLQVPHGGGGV